MATIARLTYYPVKGCAGISVDSAKVTAGGLAHDRTFMVIDGKGLFRSQRNTPRLAAIVPQISGDGMHLALWAPGSDGVKLDVDINSSRIQVGLFKNTYGGIDQGDEVADWLTEALGAPSRLVRVPPEHDRVTSGAVAGTTAYADSSPLLITSMSSLAALNGRIVAREAEPIPMDRFRANIVVDGWDEPHTEDEAERLQIGAVELAFAKLAIRCVVTTLDQSIGAKRGHEPLRTLADYRRSGSGVAFGARFVVLSEGTISVGAPIEALG